MNLHNEEPCDLYTALSIVKIAKWRMLHWAGHVAKIERKEMHGEFWWRYVLEKETYWETDREAEINIQIYRERYCKAERWKKQFRIQ
jgi:hypothetical protein